MVINILAVELKGKKHCSSHAIYHVIASQSISFCKYQDLFLSLVSKFMVFCQLYAPESVKIHIIRHKVCIPQPFTSKCLCSHSITVPHSCNKWVIELGKKIVAEKIPFFLRQIFVWQSAPKLAVFMKYVLFKFIHNQYQSTGKIFDKIPLSERKIPRDHVVSLFQK